mgnify:CR=1 FL=1
MTQMDGISAAKQLRHLDPTALLVYISGYDQYFRQLFEVGVFRFLDKPVNTEQPTVGSEQGGVRPVMILQNDKGNYFSSTVIIAPMTAKTGKHNLPIHVTVYAGEAGIGRTSMVLLEQIRVLDKSRLGEYIGHLEAGRMKDVEYAMAVSLGLFDDSGIEEEFGREQVEYEQFLHM